MLDHRLDGGHRNEVWSGHIDGQRVAVRQSRRAAQSLAWELELIDYLDGHGMLVPTVIVPTPGNGPVDIVVQRWIDGREPASEADWRLVADELQRVHDLTPEWPQRPGCVEVARLDATSTSVDADMSRVPTDVAADALGVFASFADEPTVVIHGDPAPSNLRITDDGRVGLLDWDESRRDVALHDLSNLGVQVLSDADHRRAERLSDAWETVNAWVVEPDYARERLASLRSSR